MIDANDNIRLPDDFIRLINHDLRQEEKLFSRCVGKINSMLKENTISPCRIVFSLKEYKMRTEYLQNRLNVINNPNDPEYAHLVTLLVMHQFLSPLQVHAHQNKEQSKQDAIAKLKKAIEAGDSLAELVLGSCYLIGLGVPQDLSQAAKHFENASKNGNSIAMVSLAECYMSGMGVEKSIKKSERLLLDAVSAGNTIAMYSVATLFIYGKYGIRHDRSAGIALLEQAHVKGNTDATYQLAIETAKDDPKYVELLEIASNDGNNDATFDLALFYQVDDKVENKEKALTLLLELITAGYSLAAHVLANNYMHGINGVTRNFAKAFELYIHSSLMEKTNASFDGLSNSRYVACTFSPLYLLSMFEKLNELAEEARKEIMALLPALARCCAKACKDYPNSKVAENAIRILSWWRRRTSNTEFHYWASLTLGYTLDTLYIACNDSKLSMVMTVGFLDDQVINLSEKLRQSESTLIIEMIKQDPSGFIDCLLKDDIYYATTEQKKQFMSNIKIYLLGEKHSSSLHTLIRLTLRERSSNCVISSQPNI